MKLPTLQAIQQYCNDALITDFCHKNPQITLTQAQQNLKDLLSWLWLNQHRKKQHKITRMFGPLLILDELWHTFILHTRDYHHFCQTFFGTYVHHDVEPPHREHILTPEELADFLEDCFALLGEDWVDRYFSDLYN